MPSSHPPSVGTPIPHGAGRDRKRGVSSKRLATPLLRKPTLFLLNPWLPPYTRLHRQKQRSILVKSRLAEAYKNSTVWESSQVDAGRPLVSPLFSFLRISNSQPPPEYGAPKHGFSCMLVEHREFPTVYTDLSLSLTHTHTHPGIICSEEWRGRTRIKDKPGPIPILLGCKYNFLSQCRASRTLTCTWIPGKSS